MHIFLINHRASYSTMRTSSFRLVFLGWILHISWGVTFNGYQILLFHIGVINIIFLNRLDLDQHLSTRFTRCIFHQSLGHDFLLARGESIFYMHLNIYFIYLRKVIFRVLPSHTFYRGVNFFKMSNWRVIFWIPWLLKPNTLTSYCRICGCSRLTLIIICLRRVKSVLSVLCSIWRIRISSNSRRVVAVLYRRLIDFANVSSYRC